MSEINAEKLILSMKRRPALYNKSDANYYCHKKQKSKLWMEVCREVFPNYDNLKSQKKVEYCHELQRRWKSLRTCFTRELATQRKEKIKKEISDNYVKKRRKVYEYFNMMTFLLDSDNVVEVTENDLARQSEDITRQSESSHDSDDPLDNFKDEAAEYHTESAGNSYIEVEGNTGILRPTYDSRNETFDIQILDSLKKVKNDEEDEDRQFVLSLIPSFRKLEPKQKFEARIEILRILKEITFGESSSS